MNTKPRIKRRLTMAVVLPLMVAMMSMSTTACIPTRWTWSMGKTHSLRLEPGAQRASIIIHRVPRKALNDIRKAFGVRKAQDALWAVGQPPVMRVCVYGVCLSTQFVSDKFHGYIYGDTGDFNGALIEAAQNYDCLALTLISQGLYNKNWTHKGDCPMGSLT